LNFFLYINRNIIFFFTLFLTVVFLIIVFSKQFKLNNVDLNIIEKNLPNADISEPKFAINNETKKIFITAREGNFLSKDEILLKDNVRFKSNEFSIETNKVIFNRNNQTAQSETRSIFKSKNTIISSDGFNIYDKGNKITFFGNSQIVLK
tara:strand:+ start:762 stop:1211 length:450 start_codon:yes stop_codon:yes gene_type:complete